MGGTSVLEFKVVESSTVTDEELTRLINDQIRQGWSLDGIQFAMRESSKRPAMAFVVFTRGGSESGGDDKVVSINRKRKKERP